MKKSVISTLLTELERLVQIEQESGVEFWLARDLQGVLGYTSWQNFRKVVGDAATACETSGNKASDHFNEVSKMIPLGKGAQREIQDFMLTRYACYLIAQNGDPSKDEIAFCQTYFAVQTRRQEIIEKRISEVERLRARKKLTESEKLLSTQIYEKLGDDRSFGVIRSKGDQALFGGHSTQEMKTRLGCRTTARWPTSCRRSRSRRRTSPTKSPPSVSIATAWPRSGPSRPNTSKTTPTSATCSAKETSAPKVFLPPRI